MRLLRCLSVAAPLLIFACADDAKTPDTAEPEVTGPNSDAPAPVAAPPPETTQRAVETTLPVTKIEQAVPSPRSCARDGAEPNDNVAQAISLGSVGDRDPVTLRTIARPNLTTG